MNLGFISVSNAIIKICADRVISQALLDLGFYLDFFLERINKSSSLISNLSIREINKEIKF